MHFINVFSIINKYVCILKTLLTLMYVIECNYLVIYSLYDENCKIRHLCFSSISMPPLTDDGILFEKKKDQEVIYNYGVILNFLKRFLLYKKHLYIKP